MTPHLPGHLVKTCFCGHGYHEGVCPECLQDGVVAGDAPSRAQDVASCVRDGKQYYACARFRERGMVA